MTCWNCDPPEPDPYCIYCRSECTRSAPCPCCDSRGFPRPHRLAEEILIAYEQRIPGAREAVATDLRSRYSRRLLVHFLAVIDAAMSDEDVPARTRHRVMNTVVYGSVTPPDVIDRDRARRASAQLVKLRGQPLPVPDNEEATPDA